MSVSSSSREEERWAPIFGWTGFYEASDLGNVRSVTRSIVCRNGVVKQYKGRPLSPVVRSGRPMVTLSRDGEDFNQFVHRLVLLAFVGPPPEGTEGCHEHNDAIDNRLVNLRWDTHSNNLLDMQREGNDVHCNREVCPRSHPLKAPNLVASEIITRKRSCRACNSARALVRNARLRGVMLDLKVVSDQCYERIMWRASIGAPDGEASSRTSTATS
jgi:hypothetical protein